MGYLLEKEPGARLTNKHKPKIPLVPYSVYGTYENLWLKMLSETAPGPEVI